MPIPDILLDIRNNQTPGGPGWVATTATNGEQYTYKYTGGSDSNGNVRIRGSGTIDIRLTADARYHIGSIAIAGDTAGDVHVSSQADRTATLQDDDTEQNDDIYFAITIRDTVANAWFVCDPEIHNEGPE